MTIDTHLPAPQNAAPVPTSIRQETAPAEPAESPVSGAGGPLLNKLSEAWEFEPGVAPYDRALPPHFQPWADRFTQFVQIVREQVPDASDVQFVGGGQVWIHANGEDVRTQWDVSNDELLIWAKIFGRGGLGDEELRHGETGTVENAVDVAGVRLRMTFRRQLGGFGLNFRILPPEPPSIDSPRFQANPIPQPLIDLVMNSTQGLILVEGPTGSGKSTLQAALINEVNRTQRRHIYTLEDPIEFVHTSNKSLITQREVGTHVDSFAQGLMTAKRSKPGIILLGELRDKQTMRAALESAGEGHLVIATSHASAVPEAIATFVGSFPGDEQNEVRQRIATTLRAVIVQKLIPTVTGKVVPVRELMVANTTLRAAIQEGVDGTGDGIRKALMSSVNKDEPGIFSRDDDLLRLVRKKLIDPQLALAHAIVETELRHRMEREGLIAPTSGGASGSSHRS